MKNSLPLILALALSPYIASAAGLQVSPEKLDFQLSKNATRSQTLVVVNPTADVQLFEAYLDENHPGIEIAPASFTLEAGARKNVTVTVSGKDLGPGVLLATMSLVSRPLSDSRVNVGAGAKIPITIRVEGTTNRRLSIWGLAASVAALILLFGIRKGFFRRS